MDAVRPWLFVGKLRETLDISLLLSYNIGAMLQLCEAAPQPGIESLFLPVCDGEPLDPTTLAEGIAFVRAQKAAGRVVLVACGMGVSRAATFATAALKEEEGLSLRGAFGQVVAARREARPHPLLWAALCARYDDDTPFAEMVKMCRPPTWQ